MSFLAPKAPKIKPMAPVVLAPQPFNPTAATAARPEMATQGSGDSNIGRATGTQTLINRLQPRQETQRKRSLLGGGM